MSLSTQFPSPASGIAPEGDMQCHEMLADGEKCCVEWKVEGERSFRQVGQQQLFDEANSAQKRWSLPH